MDVKLIRCEDVDWIHVAQHRVQWQAVVNTVMILRVPWKAGSPSCEADSHSANLLWNSI